MSAHEHAAENVFGAEVTEHFDDQLGREQAEVVPLEASRDPLLDGELFLVAAPAEERAQEIDSRGTVQGSHSLFKTYAHWCSIHNLRLLDSRQLAGPWARLDSRERDRD